MAYFEQGTLVIKGDVRRAYTLQAPVEPVYEYLSNMRNLLSQIPNMRRLQIGTRSGRARLFMTVDAMGMPIDGAIDVEPTYEPENYIIRLKTPAEPLGPVPPRHMSGTFQGYIKVTPNQQNSSRVSSRIVLAFDATQIELLNLLPRPLIEASGPTLLQEYAETLCDQYISNLLRSFRQWLVEHKNK